MPSGIAARKRQNGPTSEPETGGTYNQVLKIVGHWPSTCSWIRAGYWPDNRVVEQSARSRQHWRARRALAYLIVLRRQHYQWFMSEPETRTDPAYLAFGREVRRR